MLVSLTQSTTTNLKIVAMKIGFFIEKNLQKAPLASMYSDLSSSSSSGHQVLKNPGRNAWLLYFSRSPYSNSCNLAPLFYAPKYFPFLLMFTIVSDLENAIFTLFGVAFKNCMERYIFINIFLHVGIF